MKTTDMTERSSKTHYYSTVLALGGFLFLGLQRYIGWRWGFHLDLQTAELKLNEDFDSVTQLLFFSQSCF